MTTTGASPRTEDRRGIRRHHRTLELLVLVAVAVAVAVGVRTFVAEGYYIPSASMAPTLAVHDRVVVSRLAYHLHAPHRGDIVVFPAPLGVLPAGRTSSGVVGRALTAMGAAFGLVDRPNVLIKRVIGLPGETVEGRSGHVLVDGRILVEPYLRSGTVTSGFGPFRLGAHDVWVMGDNRGVSDDSRTFGAIDERRITGRAIWKVWPLDHATFL